MRESKDLQSKDREYPLARDIAHSIGQTHLFKFWGELNDSQKKKLAKQIEALDVATFRRQKDLLNVSQRNNDQAITPYNDYVLAGNMSDFRRGKSLIASRLVGCLVVAGGQGTRLKVDGPKGKCPVTLVKKKSLFQLLSEKTLAAGKQAGCRLPLAIMTSPGNHEMTIAFFEKNHYFGLDPSQVTFFMQKQLPFLDKQGNMFLESKDTIAAGPDGNGGALYEFYNQGIWDKWQAEKICYVNFILIDNPLADPFDAELVGFHERLSSDVVIKGIMRDHPQENVGVIVKQRIGPLIIEYSELESKDREAVDEKGRLFFPVANISLFSFSMEFIRKVSLLKLQKMPLHKAFKAVKYLKSESETVLADKPMAWKFERFIFDLLLAAERVGTLIYSRESCFAPLKNFYGSDSLETVPYAIESLDRKTINDITKTKCTCTPLEIAQDFYYPTEDLLKTWEGHQIKNGGYLSLKGDNL